MFLKFLQIILRISVLILFINISEYNCLTRDAHKSLILNGEYRSYCDIKCGGDINHTLCNPLINYSNNCGNGFNLYHFDDEMINEILDAHNGIRNRAALIMGASNMRKLIWNKELQKMATAWIKKCDYNNADPCTTLNHNYETKNSYTLINQNFGTIWSPYTPRRPLWSLVRNWYFEKEKMEPPVHDEKHGYFNVSNNFTQLVWASSAKIGCAYARHGEGYHLVCNYFPYTYPEIFAFRPGWPCDYCPPDMPICSIIFENLCTNDAKGKHMEWNQLLATILFVIVAFLL